MLAGGGVSAVQHEAQRSTEVTRFAVVHAGHPEPDCRFDVLKPVIHEKAPVHGDTRLLGRDLIDLPFRLGHSHPGAADDVVCEIRQTQRRQIVFQLNGALVTSTKGMCART